MRSSLGPIAAVLAIALSAAPAAATQFTYVFNSNNNAGANVAADSLSAAGAAVGLSSEKGTYVSGGSTVTSNSTLSASVTGWNANKSGSNYALTGAQVGKYQYGLGVTSGANDTSSVSGCGSPGSCNQHQIDNLSNTGTSTSVDFVQILFSQAVILTGLSQVAFAQPVSTNVWLYDDDFSMGRGTQAGALVKNPALGSGALSTATTSLTQAQINAMFGQSYGGNGPCNSYTGSNSYCYDQRTGLAATLDNRTASTVWWVAASLFNPDNKSDAFKLYDFTVVYNDAPVAALPEPASWAMMIAGFGFVGAALRRKKAAERLAAA